MHYAVSGCPVAAKNRAAATVSTHTHTHVLKSGAHNAMLL